MMLSCLREPASHISNPVSNIGRRLYALSSKWISLRKKQILLPSLPFEIYGRIIQLVGSHSDLYALCLVSKAFHTESMRVLYRDVELPMNNEIISSWFRLVSEDSWKASWVVSLRFSVNFNALSSPMISPELLVAWHRQLGEGLGKLQNLKTFVFYLPARFQD
jgi:hypothetical protein